MKKTYIVPTLKVVKIQTTHLLSNSEIKVGGKYNGSTTVESRQGRGTIWDDDDYEE
jgi:hypothetical protein